MLLPELDRRRFGLGALAAGAALALPRAAFAAPEPRPMTGDGAPISATERLARVARAQHLRGQLGWGSILVEPGASLTYFTGVNWHRSERLTAALIPAEGEAVIVTPFFEEPSVRESLALPAQGRTSEEDGDPPPLAPGAAPAPPRAARPVGD